MVRLKVNNAGAELELAEKIVAVTTSGTTKRDSICDEAEGLDRGANSSAKDIPGRPPNEAEIKSHSKILALRVGDNIMALLLLMLLGLNFNEVNRVYRLYQDGQLDSAGFGKFYKRSKNVPNSWKPAFHNF